MYVGVGGAAKQKIGRGDTTSDYSKTWCTQVLVSGTACKKLNKNKVSANVSGREQREVDQQTNRMMGFFGA